VSIRAVALDLMDTVIRDPFREALRAATGLPLAELLERRDPGAWPAFERGELTEEEFVATYTRSGVPFDVEAFHRARRSGYGMLEGMAPLLDDLAGAVRLVAATNYPVWVDEVIDRFLAGRLDAVVASCEIGVRKPDRGFFAELITVTGEPADRILFVDDRQQNVVAARNVGLRAHRFASADELRDRLRSEGVVI
jgi:FMN phosphatase YigB (HAD superfamily)